jgi:uncharacterized phage protein gp47/JayE
MSFSVVITPAGPIAPSYPDLKAMLEELHRSIYGSDIYIDPDSQDGQYIAALATIIKDQNDAIISGLNSFFPASAQGVGLSTIVKINGIRRDVPSNSTADLLCVGVAGTDISGLIIGDDLNLNTQWLIAGDPGSETVVIPDAGEITTTATCTTPGGVAAAAGSLTEILTPTRNFQSVTNAADAALGAPVEQDAALRQRQSVSTAIPALSVLAAMYGALKNIIGVNRCFPYENDTKVTDDDGIPANSIAVVIDGGDAATIAATIARYKTPGTGTYGTTSQTITNDLGAPQTINFFLLDTIALSLLISVKAGAGYVTSTAGKIQGASAAWLNALAIGQDTSLNKIWSPVNLTGDAATGATGLTQAQLDPLGDTYDGLSIYQARADMDVIGGPYAAGANVIHVTNTDDMINGSAIAVTLDDNSFLKTTVSGRAGTAITMAAVIPGGRSVQNGDLVFVQGDIVLAFNEAAGGDPASVNVQVS